MNKQPVIAIFDVGKTNKKLFLFDENYKIVYERSAKFVETVDEDGDVCENIESLRLSVFDSLHQIFRKKEFELKAVNFSTYGASFVYIDEDGQPVAPLYNYLKPYPPQLKKAFYEKYSGEENVSKETASPVLGSLNSGMQLYRLKYEKPGLFSRIKYALHLPQYMSYLLSGEIFTDVTSLGCHTHLWNFEENNYHRWVYEEGIIEKLAPVAQGDIAVPSTFPGNTYKVGIGLHDSSAALIPYLVNFQEPFVLISTGTWCISFNPFNHSALTYDELKQDCLCYMQYKGRPVKASRIFAGNEHEQQVKRIASYFNQHPARYRSLEYDPAIAGNLRRGEINTKGTSANHDGPEQSAFGARDLSSFASDTEAYHQLIFDLVTLQHHSTSLVLEGTAVKRIFVDGGFSKNSIYMNLLALFFPQLEVFAASTAQATAVGTALAIHQHWNSKPVPGNLIELKYYSLTHDPAL